MCTRIPRRMIVCVSLIILCYHAYHLYYVYAHSYSPSHYYSGACWYVYSQAYALPGSRLKRLPRATTIRPALAIARRVVLCATTEEAWHRRARARRTTDRLQLRLHQAQQRLLAHHGSVPPPAMPPLAAAQLAPRHADAAVSARAYWWTTQAPRPRRNTWSCSCGLITNFAIRITCYRCDSPRPRTATVGDVAVCTKGKGKGGPAQQPRCAPWANPPAPDSPSSVAPAQQLRRPLKGRRPHARLAGIIPLLGRFWR